MVFVGLCFVLVFIHLKEVNAVQLPVILTHAVVIAMLR